MPEPVQFHNVLVAVDGSPHSELALTMAIALAQRNHARMTIVTAVATVGAAAWSGAVNVPDLQAEMERGAETVLRAAVDAVPGDLPVRTVMPHGNAGPAIVEEAQRGRHDVIVLGARGVGRIGAAFGSVSGYVMHHADVAVLVAHAPRDLTTPPPG